MTPKIDYYSYLFLLLCLPIFLAGQNNNTITYPSPSNNFIEITIQTHKGLPRFGELYYHRGVTPPTNQAAYNILLDLKYLTNVYADMDQTKLTNYNHNQTNLKDENSRFAQNHLLKLAGHLCSDMVLEKYFCDTSAKVKCTFKDAYGLRKPIAYWGGSRTNEFQQMRSFLGFKKKYLETLQNWSKEFLKGDEEIGYLVSKSTIASIAFGKSKAYDFQKKGYWLKSLISSGGNWLGPIQYLDFSAVTKNERILKEHQLKVFLAIPPEKAKILSLMAGHPLFTVVKARVFPSEKALSNSKRVQYSFELKSSIVEIYKDAALTQKIGEISIQDIITKQ